MFAALLAALAATPAAAQVSDATPRANYYLGVEALYAGNYRLAERTLRTETRRGIRTPQARWIDAICYHAMLGEVLYHQGRTAEALAEFDQACQLLLAYPDWLLQVKFQSDTTGLRPDANRARRAPPWGRSGRQFAIAQLPTTEQVMTGRLDAARAYQEGGVADFAMLWQINVVEVVRTSALAMRRRNELLGPLAVHDPISRKLSEVFARGNLAPANHWSQAWIDLLRGLAQAGIGKPDEAFALLGRSLVLAGRFDHPLTGVALMEQGRLAMLQGDHRRAEQLLAEAGFSAFYYQDWDVLGEAVWLGWLNHLSGAGGGIYPAVEPVAAWTQANRLQHTSAKLRVAQAESLLWNGQVDAAATLLDDVGRRLGEMRGGLTGLQHAYLQAVAHTLRGQLAAGNQALAAAVAARAATSPRSLQLARANEMFDSRLLSSRAAIGVYAELLADPLPAHWALDPLDSIAALQTPADVAFDRWFHAALDRRDAVLALEIAEQAKRRRFLANKPLGGRLLALRTILEAPETSLSDEARQQRRRLMTMFPAYRAAAEAARQLHNELRAAPLLPADSAETRALNSRYADWAATIRQRQRLLAELALRRLPSPIEFPPYRSTVELQQALDQEEALVVFHRSADQLYGFFVAPTEVRYWHLGEARRLRGTVSDLLKAVGNFGPNRALSVADLGGDGWRAAATKAFAAVLAEGRLEPAKMRSLVIVPDDVLWYLPFEALIDGSQQPHSVLADRTLIRYGPTAALAVADARSLRRPQRTGLVAGRGRSDDANGEELLGEMEAVLRGPVVLGAPLPQPGYLMASLLDELVVLSDLEIGHEGLRWPPLPRARGAADDPLQPWFELPHGGPERIVLSGFTTEAEQGLPTTRRGAARATAAARPGDEVFRSLCSMMAYGGRTILLTRWRTGGRTNFELVREFMLQLPHARATEAWQRACLLARESPLDLSSEPRIKRADDGELPTADHPFFWAGYLLVDTSPLPEPVEPSADSSQPEADAAENDATTAARDRPSQTDAEQAAPADET